MCSREPAWSRGTASSPRYIAHATLVEKTAMTQRPRALSCCSCALMIPRNFRTGNEPTQRQGGSQCYFLSQVSAGSLTRPPVATWAVVKVHRGVI